MKDVQKLLNALRSLPEESRKLLAQALTAISAFLLFVFLAISFSSHLTPISGTNVAITSFSETGLPPEVTEVVGPLAGIAEAVKSLSNIIPRPNYREEKTKSWADRVYAFAQNSLSGIKRALAESWQYVYGPFK